MFYAETHICPPFASRAMFAHVRQDPHPHPNLRRVDHRLWPRSPFSKIEPRPRSSQPCLPSTCSQHPTPAQICEGSTTAYGPGRLSPKLSPAPAKSSLPSVVYIILVAHLLQSRHHRRHHDHVVDIHLFSNTHTLPEVNRLCGSLRERIAPC